MVTVKQWAAWSHALSTPEAWSAWALDVYQKPATSSNLSLCQEGSTADLNLSTIPASYRRHASQATKMALATTLPLMADYAIDYVIFASQHGEAQRSIGLLTDIVANTLLSPVAFTHSVHNIAVGLLAIIQRLQINTTAIAAGVHTFTMAMIEAMAWLQQNPGKTVLLTMYDDEVPHLYKAFCPQQALPYVVTLLLTTRPYFDADSSKHSLTQSNPGETCFTPTKNSLRRAEKHLRAAIIENSSAEPNQNETCFAPLQSTWHQQAPEALQFLAWLLSTHEPALVQPFMHQAIRWTEQDS